LAQDVRGVDREQSSSPFRKASNALSRSSKNRNRQHVEVGDLPEPRQVGRPPVRPPCERHLEPRAQLPEAVRPRDHGKIEVQAVEILVSEGVLGQHLQADQRQEIFPMLFLRDEADGGGVEHLGRFEAFEADLVGPGQVLRIHHGRERPAHVFGGHGLSVAPFRQRVHVERERLAVVADDAAVGQHRLGFQRERMQRHQRLVELAEELGRHHVLVEVVVEALGIRPQIGHQHPALLREFRRERIRRFLPARTRKDFCGGRRGSQQRQSHSQHDAFHAGILPSAAGLGKPDVQNPAAKQPSETFRLQTAVIHVLGPRRPVRGTSCATARARPAAPMVPNQLLGGCCDDMPGTPSRGSRSRAAGLVGDVGAVFEL
jgi:hypothetical protein